MLKGASQVFPVVSRCGIFPFVETRYRELEQARADFAGVPNARSLLTHQGGGPLL